MHELLQEAKLDRNRLEAQFQASVQESKQQWKNTVLSGCSSVMFAPNFECLAEIEF